MLSLAIAAAVYALAGSKIDRAVRLEAGQVMALADDAGKRGDIRTAEEAYEALSHDPDPEVRAEALFRHGMMLAKAGDLTKAATLLRRLIDRRPDAIRARLELAQLLQRMGDSDGALRELRAAQATGLPPQVARMVDRYSEALRASRRFGASFQIAIAPDTNVNRSTRSDTLGTVFGEFRIDDDSKARSGVGLALSGQAFRRVPFKRDHALLARISGSADLYRHTDFNDIAVDLAAGPELHLGRSRLNVEAALTQRWYGMRPSVRSARISGSFIHPLGRMTQLQLIGSAAIADYRVNDLQDGKTYYGALRLERALSATTGISLGLSAGRTNARDAAYSTTEWRARLIGWRDIGRATVTAEAEFGRLRADERLALLPERREDRYTRLTFGATLRQFSVGGFAPVTRIVIERNRSSVEFYDYRRRRTEIGISRAF